MENTHKTKRRVIALCLELLNETTENTELIKKLNEMKIYELEMYYRELRDTPQVHSLLVCGLKTSHANSVSHE